MDFVKDALKLLELRSVSEEGNEEAVNFLIPLFEQMGAKLVLQQIPHSLPDHNKRQYNLLATFGDDLVDSRTRKGLLLTNHVDTCDPGNPADWTDLDGKPLEPREKEGWIRGLGAAAGKLDFLCKIAACQQFVGQEFREPVYLAATCGGTSLLQGSRYLIQSGAVNPRHVIVGAPTNLRLVSRQKMHSVWRVRVSFVSVERDANEFNAKIFISSKARGAHVSHAGSEQNAIANVLLFLDQIRGSPIPTKLFSLQGGASLSRVPDVATAGIVITSKDLDFIRDRFRSITSNHRQCGFEMRFGGTGDKGLRLLPEEVTPAIFRLRDELAGLNEELRMLSDPSFRWPESRAVISAVKQERDHMDFTLHCDVAPEFASGPQREEIEQEIKKRFRRVGEGSRTISVDARRVLAVPSFVTDPSSTFSRTLQADLQRVGVPSDFTSAETSCEAGFFAEKGYEVAVFGPGEDAGNLHAANEKVRVDDLMSAVRFYSRSIEAFCVRGI
ncbi:MAG: M20/M25/M40 family metallo-hydrolase [Bdellovibrionales bacterium]|nr:M20/M25/M40 family metallo-hydrolase [Bdellovibrionales bacterium]